MNKGPLVWKLIVVLLVNDALAGTPIVLDSHFSYIVVGGDHVAESVGRYLATRDPNKTVLVLKGSQCNDVLEPSEPSRLWLETSYLFAESAHYLGYEFIDPFLRGSKPGIAFTNQTMGYMPPQQQLYAVDPNLKLLTDARPQRIIYNKASSTVLGVEVSINFEPHYIFAKEELILAGRCMEDYQLLSKADILSQDDLLELLHNVPLEFALKSPIISPIFALNTNPSSDGGTLTSQPYCLLATELYIETLSRDKPSRKKTAIEGIQPNAKVNIVVHENPPKRWIGFSPSVIYQESTTELANLDTILSVLVDTIELCIQLGSSETFQKLGLTLQRHQVPPSTSCPPDDQPGGLLCFVNHTLSTVYGGPEEVMNLHFAKVTILHETEFVTEDFHLKTSRNLRVLPFGLTAPFLEHWWKRIFNATKTVREYTTRTGIMSHNHQPLPNSPPMDTLLEKLKERLKVIDSIAARHV
ncbi:AGAP012262-PA-like protein [Anopheles sinensis]|uniref:AGAP012262-PA-like protein n=1 Tax=Anopheles sinensis TaxID=74873 RepID=A0A084WHZ6_ANOSI|nr:AGAP012262-PA-like protein [Anopheles sinensis]